MFADRLIAGVRAKGPLCVGIDPHASMIPALFGKPGPEAAAKWGVALVERCVGRAAVVKPQAGLFERWGASGLRALEEVCRAATRAGLIVILDAKRGDIGSTAEQYAVEAFERFRADAVTVNPYMGRDSVEPYLAYPDKGVILLCRTSNPGGSDLQFLDVGGEKLYERVARLAAREWNTTGQISLVVGATFPAEIARVRAIVGDVPLLVPGIGAQGGDIDATVRAGATTSGGLMINSSRAILYAGSGEANFANHSRYGLGIFKSTDGCNTCSCYGGGEFATCTTIGCMVLTANCSIGPAISVAYFLLSLPGSASNWDDACTARYTAPANPSTNMPIITKGRVPA